MTNTVCPACEREQPDGLLCHYCCEVLERDLGDVPAIVAELDITLSKQARIGTPGKSGLARERTPVNVGAMNVAGDLANTLITWARDVSSEQWWPTDSECTVVGGRTSAAARYLLSEVPAIRRHPAVVELVDEITDAIRQARRVVDRPADSVFLGPCKGSDAAIGDCECGCHSNGAYPPPCNVQGGCGPHWQVVCLEDLYARPGASHARCRVCSNEVDVLDRRAELLDEAKDRIVTVREAAQWVGGVGNIDVTEDRIRGYIRWDKLPLRSLPDDVKAFRLGDLLDLLAREHERKERRTRRAS